MPIKFNWVLQIYPPEKLDTGKRYPFELPGNRAFPIDTPIDLIDADRVPYAIVQITHYTNCNDKTTGMFQVIRLYNESEQAFLTKYWREHQ